MTGSKAAKVFHQMECLNSQDPFSTLDLLMPVSSSSLTSTNYLTCSRHCCQTVIPAAYQCSHVQSLQSQWLVWEEKHPDPRLKGARGKAPLTSASNSCYKTPGSSTFHRSAQPELYFTIPQEFTHFFISAGPTKTSGVFLQSQEAERKEGQMSHRGTTLTGAELIYNSNMPQVHTQLRWDSSQGMHQPPKKDLPEC